MDSDVDIIRLRIRPAAGRNHASAASQPLSSDLGFTRGYQWILVNSLILIGVGFGPLLIAPASEKYGRKSAILAGSAVFILWNTCCGFASDLSQMLAFRLLAGFGACTADAVAGGVIGDIWPAERRGRAFAVFMVAPLLGPGVGPIAGAYISNSISWRWAFWITSLATAVFFIAALLFLKETFEPRLAYLHRQRISSFPHSTEHGPAESRRGTAETTHGWWVHLQRPLRMLATQLIIQLIAIYMALLYGTMFLFLYMYSTLWTGHYGQSARVGSLNYLSAALGYILGVQSKCLILNHRLTIADSDTVAGHLNDKIYSILKARSDNKKGRPEFRVPVMCIGTILMPIGLLWWGWTGERRLHWILPNIGCMLFTAGCYICSASVSIYTIDAYTRYAASAISTNLVLRSNFAALFPLFAPYMFEAVGFGRGATILAGGFSAVGFTTVVTLWFWGDKIRRRGQYCATDDEYELSVPPQDEKAGRS